MNTCINAHIGYIKRGGTCDSKSQLRIEPQSRSESSKDGSFIFKEHAPAYLIKPGLYGGVIVRITRVEGRSSLETLDEHSVTLTIPQTEALISALNEELAKLRLIAGAVET